MVTLTNAEANRAVGALHEISKLWLRVAPAIKVRQMLGELVPHMKNVEDVRQERLKLVAQKDDSGRVVADKETGAVVFPSPEAEAEFGDFYRELMSETHEYKWVLTISDFEGTPQVKPGFLFDLGPLFIEEEL